LPHHFLEHVKSDKPFDLDVAHEAIKTLLHQVKTRSRTPGSSQPQIVGQDLLIRRLVIAFLIGEHCLLEGLPGLVKTEVSKTIADMLGLVFRRIQFTPDMMPSDLISRERLGNVSAGEDPIEWVPGPIFTNILLADELNRAPSKVQSALLEATEERQVTTLYKGRVPIRPRMSAGKSSSAATVGELDLLDASPGFFGKKLEVEQLQHFMVLGTMNPIEQEGVFPLSEAQLDRFAFKVIVDYPLGSDLLEISEHAFQYSREKVDHDSNEHLKTLYFLSLLREKLFGEEVLRRWKSPDNDLRKRCEALINFSHLGKPQTQDDDMVTPRAASNAKQEELLSQISQWQTSTNQNDRRKAQTLLDWRSSEDYPDVLSGSSPRGLLKLIRAAHAEAFLRHGFEGDVVAPTWDDVRAVAPDVLRHRIRLAPNPMIRVNSDDFVLRLLEWLDPADWAVSNS
jgi:MoxR-like ATPase